MDPVLQLLYDQADLLRSIPVYGERVHIDIPDLDTPHPQQIHLELPLTLESAHLNTPTVQVSATWTAYTVAPDGDYLAHALEVQTAMVNALVEAMPVCTRWLVNRETIAQRELGVNVLPVSVTVDAVLQEAV